MPDQARSTSETASSNLLVELEQSGILSREQVTRVESSLSAQTAEVDSLTTHLTAEGLLTDFQARMIAEGRLHELALGNYNLVDRLGAGGMGEVYRAVHRRMKREVALKVLPPAAVSDHEVVERFHREVEAAARLTHPNIVTAYDADESHGTHFLVMELIDGDDFSRLVRDRGPLSPALALEYIAQAARGLEYAHAQGVIHRDIKPANLLLDSQGTVRMLDLGLASLEAAAADAGQAPALTHTGSIMGTVDYMAPEQAEDTRTADARSDIYSLGCTLYFLLTARPPYSGSTLMQRLLAHREQPQPDLPDGISPALNALFRKMIARDPADRYHSMTELLTALDDCRTTDPALSDTDHGTGVTRRDLPPPGPDNATEPAPTVTLETLNNSSHLADTLRQPAESRLRRRKSQREWLWIGVVPMLAAFLLAGLVLRLKTPAGTIVLEIDDPAALGAVVTVDDQQKITVARQGEEPIEISADGKRHTLKVSKAGFETFTEEFTIGSGETKPIRIRLEKAGRAGPHNEPTAEDAVAANLRPDIPQRELTIRHRRAAEVILQNGGQISIRHVHGGGTVRDRSELPDRRFYVIGVYFLGGTTVTSSVLEQLVALGTLEELMLHKCELTPELTAALSAMKSINRIHLRLLQNPLTDKDLHFLASITDLRYLNLEGNRVTDAACNAISQHRGLEFLSLNGSSVTSVGVGKLIALQSLEELQLDNSQLTNEAVESLLQFPNLMTLRIGKTGITPEGARQLADSLPHCAVLHETLKPSNDEKEAIKAVLDSGWTVGSLSTPPDNAYSADIVTVPADCPPENWGHLQMMRGVKFVVIDGTMDDVTLSKVGGLEYLTGLVLGDSQLNSESLGRLGQLKRLQVVSFTKSGVELDADVLARWHELHRLRELYLHEQLDSLNNAAMAQLARLKSLQRIKFSSPNVTTDGLGHLQQLQRLEYLDVNSPIDEQAVPLLGQMKKLYILDISGQHTKLNADSVARLREALPDCMVFWNDDIEHGNVLQTLRTPRTSGE